MSKRYTKEVPCCEQCPNIVIQKTIHGGMRNYYCPLIMIPTTSGTNMMKEIYKKSEILKDCPLTEWNNG